MAVSSTINLEHLEQFTVEEKLRAMELLWANLIANESNIPMTEWQRRLLDDRDMMVQEGKAEFTDWDEAKKRISSRLT